MNKEMCNDLIRTKCCELKENDHIWCWFEDGYRIGKIFAIQERHSMLDFLVQCVEAPLPLVLLRGQHHDWTLKKVSDDFLARTMKENS